MQQAVLECAKNWSMIMGTSQKLSSLDNDPCMTPFKLILNDHEIRRVKKNKVFGSDNCLTWEDHIECITLKINRGIGIIKRGRQTYLRKGSTIIISNLDRSLL